jgi:hypothetical protein
VRVCILKSVTKQHRILSKKNGFDVDGKTSKYKKEFSSRSSEEPQTTEGTLSCMELGMKLV